MILRRHIAGMVLGVLLFSPVLAEAQDNPWYVPPAGAQAYGAGAPGWQGGAAWQAGGWREPAYAVPSNMSPSYPVPSYAGTGQAERMPAAQCQPEARWAASGPAAHVPGPRPMSNAGGLNAVAALGVSAITTGSNRDWRPASGTVAGYAMPPSPPPLIFGEFPPLDGDATDMPAPRGETGRHAPERRQGYAGSGGHGAQSYAAPGYAAPAHAAPDYYAPPGYEPRSRDEAARGGRREGPPRWSSYPAPAPSGPSTLGGGWGPGTGVYGSYAYPYASGVPAAYGWF